MSTRKSRAFAHMRCFPVAMGCICHHAHHRPFPFPFRRCGHSVQAGQHVTSTPALTHSSRPCPLLPRSRSIRQPQGRIRDLVPRSLERPRHCVSHRVCRSRRNDNNPVSLVQVEVVGGVEEGGGSGCTVSDDPDGDSGREGVSRMGPGPVVQASGRAVDVELWGTRGREEERGEDVVEARVRGGLCNDL